MKKNTFGKKLKALRLKAGISQLTLAFDAQMTASQISSFENGKSMPTYETIARLSKSLEVSPEIFFNSKK